MIQTIKDNKGKVAAGGGVSVAVVLFCYSTFVTKEVRHEDMERVQKIENWAFESVPMSKM